MKKPFSSTETIFFFNNKESFLYLSNELEYLVLDELKKTKVETTNDYKSKAVDES
mgnify:CR=1 FL=1